MTSVVIEQSGMAVAHALDGAAELIGVVAAAHRPQHAGRAGLNRHMQMARHPLVRPAGEQFRLQFGGADARQANPRRRRPRENALQQVGQPQC